MRKVKSLIAGAVACAVVASLFAAGSSVLAATPLAGTTHNVGEATTAPTIDGNLNDTLWTTGTPFEVSNPCKYKDADDNQQTWPGFKYKWAWDANNLYLAVDMTDNSLFFNSSKAFNGDADASADAMDPWEYTNMDLRFSPTDNMGTLDDITDPNYVNGDAQYIITYQDDGKPCFRVGAWPNNDQKDRYASGAMNNAKLACSKTDHGWDLECAFPWSSIAVTNAASGSKFSFYMGQQVVTNEGASDSDYNILPSMNDIYSSDGYTVDNDNGVPSVTWAAFEPWADQLLLTSDPADAAVSSSSAPASSSEPASSSAPASSSEPASSSAPASSSEPASSSAPASSSEPASSNAPASSSTPASSSEEASSYETPSYTTPASSSSASSEVSSAASLSDANLGGNNNYSDSSAAGTAAPAATGNGSTASSNPYTGSMGGVMGAVAVCALAAGTIVAVKTRRK